MCKCITPALADKFKENQGIIFSLKDSQMSSNVRWTDFYIIILCRHHYPLLHTDVRVYKYEFTHKKGVFPKEMSKPPPPHLSALTLSQGGCCIWVKAGYTPLVESPAHCRTLCERLGFGPLLKGTSAVSWRCPWIPWVLNTEHYILVCSVEFWGLSTTLPHPTPLHCRTAYTGNSVLGSVQV